jgi:hypothetical protein
MSEEETIPADETASDYRDYIKALRQKIKEQEKRGEQIDFADFMAASGTRDQARYWLHICLMEERAKSAAAVNAHDALTARVAALEDALQGFVDESEGWFDEHTPVALLAEARALLQNGGA